MSPILNAPPEERLMSALSPADREFFEKPLDDIVDESCRFWRVRSGEGSEELRKLSTLGRGEQTTAQEPDEVSQ